MEHTPSPSIVAGPPVVNMEAPKTGSKARVLVVEADYFPLTCRIDPCVIFWKPGVATPTTRIPKGISHIWISQHALKAIRQNLLGQAIAQGIVIMRCPLGELRRRLLPFWGDPRNRSLILPADSGDNNLPEPIRDLEFFEDNSTFPIGGLSRSIIDTIVEKVNATTLGEAETPIIEKESELEVIKETSHLQKRRRLLKLAANRVKKRQAEGKPATKSTEVLPAAPILRLVSPQVVRQQPQADFVYILSQLPAHDRLVYEFYYGLGEGKGRQATFAEVSSEFGLPQDNVKKIIERVQRKLGLQNILEGLG
jgi:hypothetical protein